MSVMRIASCQTSTDWRAIAKELGPSLDAGAERADSEDRFVTENFALLKEVGLSAAGVPAQLGGGDADIATLAEVLRGLAYHCSSTALAFAMHTHQVVMAAWRWRHQAAPVEGLLTRVAAERLMVLSSGGSDWLHSSGKATRAEGGYRIDARKAFASGAPSADLFMTSAVYDGPHDGPTVLHFVTPMACPEITVEPTWAAMGMRGTGSHDVVLTGLFVPDEAIFLRRAKGRWHLLFHITTMIAIPLIYAVYVGVAERARDIAVEAARRRRPEDHLAYLVGGLENALATIRLAHADMVRAAVEGDPGMATTNRVMTGRQIVGQSVLSAVDAAMAVAGGAAFYRRAGIERLFRDAQAARFHPLQDGIQRQFAGRLALGWDAETTG